MSRICRMLAFVASMTAGSAQPGLAAPAFVIRFFGSPVTIGCDTVTWSDILTFYNATDVPVTVRIVGVSNGSPNRTSPDSIVLPPHTLVYPEQLLITAWIPDTGRLPKLWMMQLDIPDGVVIESRNEVFLTNSCIIFPNFAVSLAKVSMPVFRSAVPANQQQVHLGTDVGSKDAHINVGIYNQSHVVANAHIEIRRSCDDTVIDARDVQIPPDSLEQFTNFRKGPNVGCSAGMSYNVGRYTLVTVDQPSMTFATVLGHGLNVIPGIAPEVGLGMPSSARF